MKINHTGEQTPELDLNDPATVKELLDADVLKPSKDDETEAVERAISQAKPSKVTLTLSPAEHSQLTRMAAVRNQSVKEFLHSKIQELFLDANVGQALISGPSNLSGNKTTARKISGPTGLARRSS
ncbi:hypothetical protein [Synechococcus sp. MIT S1220]|uniref:hypothetical protein n=1 Tax=Synechococcus sp. MIT S1220 TaxID=3082549 RepID=UPI0039AFD234